MRKVQFAEGEYYHLFNRGVDKRTIFYSKEDYERFKAYLFLLNDVETVRAANFFAGKKPKPVYEFVRSEPLVAIGAYCLMPTHFHLLVTPLTEHGVPKFMQRLQTGFTMFFNDKYDRSGSLFQGTYKARHANTDEYLRYLFSYIHLNPIGLSNDGWKDDSEFELRGYLQDVTSYPYSSIGEYMGNRYQILDPRKFPKHFSSAKDVQNNLKFWAKYRKETGGKKGAADTVLIDE